MDDDLLCHEDWLSSPKTPELSHFPEEKKSVSDYVFSSALTENESVEAITMYLEKEMSYLPERGYIERLRSKKLVSARFSAAVWLIKAHVRLDLCVGTVFNAVNYLDRFISLSCNCHGWKKWMIELLSIACLSIAIKFNEVSNPPWNEIQEGLDRSFESSTIQRMELVVMDAIQWRLASTTTYSYMELMVYDVVSMKPNHDHRKLTNKITKMLLRALLDLEFLEYPPSVVAVSALWCCLDEPIASSYDTLTNVSRILRQHGKQGYIKCRKMMQAWRENPFSDAIEASEGDDGCYSCYCPSSPVTVLLKEPINILDDRRVDISALFKITVIGSSVIGIGSRGDKRKRGEEEE